MSKPRLRIFAGPNGSGKSTLFDSFSKKYGKKTGVFVNADLIEKELVTKGFIDLNEYNLNLNQIELDKFLNTKTIKPLLNKLISLNGDIKFLIKENVIVINKKVTNSYIGSILSAFIRFHLLDKKESFCFETVMSHSSKIEELKKAKLKGYQTYLYFICIDDPEVNISRVDNRVKKGGHIVSPEKISSRYFNSLQNLILMINSVDKCYLFDNSSIEFKLIAKVIQNQLIINAGKNELPNWFTDYVLKYYELNQN